MTDAQTKLKLQHAHATNTLNYGHLGTALYVEHSKDWAFLRGQNAETTNHVTVAGQHAICPAFPFACIANEARPIQQSTTISAADVETQSGTLSNRGLSRLLPELFPEAGNHLRGYTTTSEEHKSAVESLLQQSQLAFGGASAVLDNGKSHRTVPIAAVVTGKNFEEVKILLIEKELIQLNDANDHGRGYQIPRIDYDEEGRWVGNGDAVQQVCFAATCDYETTQSAWLAVRYRSSTRIFHPLFHKTRYQADGNTSRLDINPVLGIPSSRTGGQAHADVSFHPQDHRMLAIVDEHGNWSIWKIEGRHTIVGRVPFVAHLQSAGRLFPERGRVSTEDAWHKICWISRSPHETDHLLVSNRSHAAIFDLAGSNLGVLDLRSGSPKEGQMILDVAKSATNPTHCYILTSTKVLLMSAGEDDWADPKGHQQMAMILSWSHYRDRSDSSLHLILVEAAQGTLYGLRFGLAS
jgi:RNA polymerase I-specific transcription initiation factor RRN6